MQPLRDSVYCFTHDPGKSRVRTKARRLGGHNRKTPRGAEVLDVHVDTLDGIRAVLSAAVSDTLLQENSSQRSRSLASLLAVALKCLEVGDLEARLAIVEQRVSHERS